MAIVKRVTRVSNPRRRTKRKKNARRRMTAKQIKHFGTKAQKAALKRRKRTTPGGTARRIKRRNTRTRRRSTSNPALVVTLGAVNPKRRKRSMARKARKSNARRVTRRRKSRNPVARRRVRVTRHRRVGVRRRRVHNRRHNPMPSFFGAVGSKGLATTVVGGLVGVAAAKFIPTLVPAGIIPAGGGVIVRTLVTGAAAWLAGMAAGRFVGKAFGDAVLFGGLMQTGSVALNALLPGFSIGGVPIGLSGMGELVNGSFSVPQNPIRGALSASPAQVRTTVSGLDRAYGRAF